MDITVLIFDIVIVAIFVLSIWYSMKQGFIKSVSSIASIVLTVVLMFAFQDGINSYLRESEFGISINEKIAESLDGDDFGDSYEFEDLGLPKFLEPIFDDAKDTVGETKDNIVEEVADGVTSAIINVLSILLLYVGIKVLLFFALKILNIIFKLPLLKSVNKIAGVAVGAVKALFIIYILCAGFMWFGPTDVSSLIADTYIAHYFYNNNILFAMFM